MKEQSRPRPSGPARLWRRLVVGPIEDAERESLAELSGWRGGLDIRVIAVCVVVAVDLTLLRYFGLSDHVLMPANALDAIGLDGWAAKYARLVTTTEHRNLVALLYWVGACVLLYMLVPVAVIRFVFRQSLSEYGLGLKRALAHLRLYAVLYACVLPLIVVVSFNPAFQEQYPFYKTSAGGVPPFFFAWELAYALQFLALEFFFRGFMVHGLKHRFGAYSVVAMMIPYCMIHFGKPFPETLAAVVAGLVLGMLSLRTGAIWLGVLIHVSVAWSMDFAALLQKGLGGG